jgi:hypothetical protein
MKNNLSEIRKIVRSVLSENLTLRDLTLSDLESVASPIKLRGGIDQLNVSLPNADVVGSLTRIDLNSEFAQRNLDYYKETLVDKLKDDSILDSTVILNPEEVWYNKVVIDNEDLKRKRRPSLKESDLRQAIREVMEEAFWTDSDWDDFISKGVLGDDAKKRSELKGDIEYYLDSESFSLKDSVEYIINMAKKIYPGSDEYDLVDLSKSVLMDIERGDDLIDSTKRDKAVKVYDEFDYMYQKVNEVVSAVADTPQDDQIDVQEGKKKSKKKKKKSRKPKDVGYPYVMSVPTGIIHSFDYGVSDAGSDGGGGGE